jgi:hypothetical protein
VYNLHVYLTEYIQQQTATKLSINTMARKLINGKDGGNSMGITITLTVSHGLAFLIILMIILNFLMNPYAIPPNPDERQLLMTPYSVIQSSGKTIGSALKGPFTDVSDENRYKLDVTKPRKAKVLMGIVTADVFGEPRYRQAFRDLFMIHPKVCRLTEYKNATKAFKDRCELIYTFVLGANVDPEGPTEIVDDSFPIIAPTEKLRPQHSLDFNETDMTFLNIR